VLGIIYALLAAASFGFNNASARRGVLTGTALQGLVVSLPLGMLIFVVGATLTDEWPALAEISFTGYGLLALAGFMHFAWAGISISAPWRPSALTWPRRSSSFSCCCH